MTPVSDRPGAMNTPACAARWIIVRRPPGAYHQAKDERQQQPFLLLRQYVGKSTSTSVRHVRTQPQPSESISLTSTVPLITYCLRRRTCVSFRADWHSGCRSYWQQKAQNTGMLDAAAPGHHSSNCTCQCICRIDLGAKRTSAPDIVSDTGNRPTSANLGGIQRWMRWRLG